ncbi:BPSL0761 family protein [Aquabacterium sp.]|uniref:BPSL0761 family protein n=1 Tax=Aquabacterium sp. TaxID=1872578 RepID=UPI0035C6FD4F
MTTPDERGRNLIWGREALDVLSTDAELPQGWRAESASLLDRYPPLSVLKSCSAADLDLLQVEHSHELAAARALFQRLRVSPTCSEQRKYTLLVILRHFY